MSENVYVVVVIVVVVDVDLVLQKIGLPLLAQKNQHIRTRENSYFAVQSIQQK